MTDDPNPNQVSQSRSPDAPVADSSEPQSQRSLSLFDCICIIIGTIIGAGIFKTPSTLANVVPSESMLILMWVIGGAIAVIGALCFAELTTCYQVRGGDYGYLKKAFGDWVGFAFSWAAFWVIRPGNISVMAIVFGTFAADAIYPGISKMVYALIALAAISGINLIGLKEGKWSQNVLAVAKVAGILLILLSAVFLSPKNEPGGEGADAAGISEVKSDSGIPDSGSSQPGQGEPSADGSEDGEKPESEESPSFHAWFWLSLVFVMFAFGGWNDIAFVATEVNEPKKNLLWSLILGVVGVLAIYLLFNVALLQGLGMDRLAAYDGANAPTEFIAIRLGDIAGRLLAGLVCVSCVGAISAMIFTSPRIYWATAEDYSKLTWLTGDVDGWRRPMILQAIVTGIFIIVFGGFEESFDLMVVASAPCFWAFLGLTVIALIVLREVHRRRGESLEGFKVPLYPLLPIVFILACGFMTYRAFAYLILKGFGIHAACIVGWVLVGIAISFFLGRNRQD